LMTRFRAICLVVVAVCAVALVVVSARPVAARVSMRVGVAATAVVGRGANLLLNPGAQAGATSAQGLDAVTIPGWRTASGLPTVVRYGTEGFPGLGAVGRRGHGQMFAGGAGGTSRLVQSVALRGPRGRPVGGVSARLSARLGASSTSTATVGVQFISATGRALARGKLRPVSGPSSARAAELVPRAWRGRVPRGAVRAEVTVDLATSRTNYDGYYARVGYDRAVADDVRFSVGARVRAPARLRPPAAHVPRYRHVFLFYFENQNVRSIVGNRRQAPYYNSLLAQGSRLDQMYAEQHPSDGNYLATAGGSVFGAPLDDPAEENNQYTIRAPTIGDRVDAVGGTWKAYEQSADGPCDDTVHGYYYDDDLPMMYFADVRDRPAYCSAHVVPLEAMSEDLASTSTTPNFTWIGVNDCDDMEGCGIRAGDRFLARRLGQIMRSPAWRRQRSLAIITFDEDEYHEHPAQRIPTLILGSRGVRHGYASPVRYTHYSLLRTIEAALGTGSLTANDRYAQPVNDIFRASAPGADAVPSPYPPANAHRAASARSHDHHPARAHHPRRDTEHRGTPRAATAFVVSSVAGTVTPISLRTRIAAAPIKVGRNPDAITLAPDERTAYVANADSQTVTPINTVTRVPGRPITVGRDPRAIVVTPDGLTAYVADAGSDAVTPIDLQTNTPEPEIRVGSIPRSLALTPDGSHLFVADWGGAQVTPIDTASNTAGPAIPVGSYPSSIVAAPDGHRVYVANYGSDTVTPISVVGGRAGRAIRAGVAPDALALTPDGSTVEVVDGDTNEVTPIATHRGRSGRPTKVGNAPISIAISPSGRIAYVLNGISGTVTPLNLVRHIAGQPISVGRYAYPTQIVVAPGGRTAIVAGTYNRTVRLLDTRTRSVSPAIKVGASPVAIAATR
jgi:YVTN family beta-propeller protein